MAAHLAGILKKCYPGKILVLAVTAVASTAQSCGMASDCVTVYQEACIVPVGKQCAG